MSKANLPIYPCSMKQVWSASCFRKQPPGVNHQCDWSSNWVDLCDDFPRIYTTEGQGQNHGTSHIRPSCFCRGCTIFHFCHPWQQPKALLWPGCLSLLHRYVRFASISHSKLSQHCCLFISIITLFQYFFLIFWLRFYIFSNLFVRKLYEHEVKWCEKRIYVWIWRCFTKWRKITYNR